MLDGDLLQEPMCRHCQRNKARRARRLCWTCSQSAAIRMLYPSTSKFAAKGPPDHYGPAPLPEPTDTVPGSAERQAVLTERASLGQALFNPRDARINLD